MQFRRPQDMPDEPDALWCRRSRLAGVIGFVVWCGVLAIPIVAGWHFDRHWITWLGAAAAIIFLPLMLGNLLSLFRSSNWVVRIARDGVWINLSSYRDRAQDSPGVLQLDYREIDSARKHVEKYSTPQRASGPNTPRTVGGDTQWHDTYLEIRLRSDLVGELEAELDRLRRASSAGQGAQGRRTRPLPVWPVSRSVLRICWYSSHATVVRPRVEQALAKLGMFVSVAPPTCRERPSWRNLTAEEAAELARELVQVHGDENLSTTLLVRVGGLSPTVAAGVVERFRDEPPSESVTMSGSTGEGES